MLMSGNILGSPVCFSGRRPVTMGDLFILARSMVVHADLLQSQNQKI